MIGSYSKFNIKPTFSITDNAFMVTLPNVNYKEREKSIIIDDLSQKEKIVKYLEQYGKIKRETVNSLFNVPSASSKVILSEMIKEKYNKKRRKW